MVAWWKRLLFSLASMVAAAVLSLACILLEAALKSHPASIHSSEVLLTIAVMVGFCLIGWVFSIPVVLIIRNIRGGRFWFYWFLGSCVGPLLMLALFAAVFFTFPQSPSAHWFNPALRPLVYFAAIVSSLTSLFYLLLLRVAQRRADRKNVAAAPTL
jgi:hypothetical protein